MSLIPTNESLLQRGLQNLRAAGVALPASNSRSAFSSGIRTGFAVLSVRGRVWRIKYRGDEKPLADPKTKEARQSIEVVLLAANPAVTKVFYGKAYVSGSDERPVCWSNDGVRPDSQVPKEQRQSATCAACPNAVWGSKITENGKQTKACADSKRLAVVPAGNFGNEMFGGPMLVRVPPASLAPLAEYDSMLGRYGLAPHMVRTRLSFDPETEYPRILFSLSEADPSGPVLSPEELSEIEALINDPRTQDVLSKEPDAQEGDESSIPADTGEAMPQTMARRATGTPPTTASQPTPPPPAKVVTPAPQPTPEDEGEDGDEDEDGDEEAPPPPPPPAKPRRAKAAQPEPEPEPAPAPAKAQKVRGSEGAAKAEKGLDDMLSDLGL